MNETVTVSLFDVLGVHHLSNGFLFAAVTTSDNVVRLLIGIDGNQNNFRFFLLSTNPPPFFCAQFRHNFSSELYPFLEFCGSTAALRQAHIHLSTKRISFQKFWKSGGKVSSTFHAALLVCVHVQIYHVWALGRLLVLASICWMVNCLGPAAPTRIGADKKNQ